jgi:mannose-6-phosphate isomerase-like protein (cupin superfamily)
VPIKFFDLLDNDGWEPLHVDPADATFYWNDGGFMPTAPVDLAATFNGAMWQSTNLEVAFGMRGRRIRPNFTVPTRHHNLRQLMVVVGGELMVESDGEKHEVLADGFWVGEAGTPYSMTAGPEGATYIECWPENMSLLETYWHDDPHWMRR